MCLLPQSHTWSYHKSMQQSLPHLSSGSPWYSQEHQNVHSISLWVSTSSLWLLSLLLYLSYFQYLPLIPWLCAMVSNTSPVTKMQHWSKHQHDPTKITDIFDGAHYCPLLQTPVTIGDKKLPMQFFSDPRDIALGLSTDGFGLFKHHNKTAWPLIIFNYNVPPKERFWKEHIISLGTIPGPKKPSNMDSFLWPLVQGLLQLEIGVTAFDSIVQVCFWLHFILFSFLTLLYIQVAFLLHSYLIVVFDDILAVSMIMHMKDHNALSSCHMCNIQGIHIPSSRITTHYVPLHCEHFPHVQHQYDPNSLPLWNHQTFIKQSIKVQTALTTTASEWLTKKVCDQGSTPSHCSDLPFLPSLLPLQLHASHLV